MHTPAEDNPDGFTEFNRLSKRLSGLDERGLVLSLSAFAEDSLGELLRVFMRDHVASKDLLEGFNAPLGTFSSRIKAAIALGLISADQFTDLENLRKIRNQFSHTWEDISFNDQRIKDRIRNLSYSSVDDNYPKTAMEKVKSSITSILIEIRVTIRQIEKLGSGAALIGTRLFAGLSGADEKEQISSAMESYERLRAKLLLAESEEEREFLLMIKQRLLDRIKHAATRASPEACLEFAKLTLALVSENWLEQTH